MEGPTPVSALIHAATMVAAGVFLVARMYPLMSAGPHPSALQVITWVGAITAVFAAAIAVAQNDIKRIIAYSTISQLGYMMMGLGVGGVSVGMFHLITHASFKSLLFLGAGSVIHGCHGEQDIRKMGGLKKLMPWTFATYAIGMMALCGVPLFFSGFWSKDEILLAARGWSPSTVPVLSRPRGRISDSILHDTPNKLGVLRKICGSGRRPCSRARKSPRHDHSSSHPGDDGRAGGFPRNARLALVPILFERRNRPLHARRGSLAGPQLKLMLLSTLVVGAAFAVGWRIYGKVAAQTLRQKDPLEKSLPAVFALLQNKFYIDEIYAATVIRLNAAFSLFADWLDRVVWGGAVNAVSGLTEICARFNRAMDESAVNKSFDLGCAGLRDTGGWLSCLQNGRVQRYLRVVGLAFSLLLLVLIWVIA